MTWTYRCLIVPEAHAQFARDLSENAAGESGSGMYTTPLSPTGALPATHWISAGLISSDFASLMPLTTHGQTVTTKAGQAATVAYLAGKVGFAVTTEQIQALFDASDITEQSADTAMARLGLVPIQPTEVSLP